MKLNILILRGWVLVCIVVGLSFSACQSQDEPKSKETNFPTTLVPTLFPSAPSTPSTVSSPASIEDVINDGSYLEECKLKYPPVYDIPAGFQDIYPGVTSDDDLVTIFGEPSKQIKTGDGAEYLYSPDQAYDAYYAPAFFIKEHVVDAIIVSTTMQVNTILTEIGCPDLINAQAIQEDPSGQTSRYNKTFFFYLRAGIWIRFETYPIKITDIPSSIGFERPNFLRSILWIGEDSKFVPFSDAVVEK